MIAGTITILFSILFYLETYNFSLTANRNTVDATFFPRIVAAMLAVCAGIILTRGVKVCRSVPKEERVASAEEKQKSRGGLLRIGEVFAVLLAVAITFKKLGFLLTAPWMMFLLFIILEKKEKRNYVFYAIASIVAPVLMFVVFYYGFSTLLPLGLLKTYLLQIL